MNTIIIKTQAEWDVLPSSFAEYTTIEIRSDTDIWVTVKSVPSNSRVEARESSSVEAWGSSRVVARESSSVVARESSSVEAWGRVSVHQKSSSAALSLYRQAVCFLYDGYGAPVIKGGTPTVIPVVSRSGNAGWLEDNAVVEVDEHVILFKRVSRDWLTQEGTENETTWVIGEVKDHPHWNPTEAECGAGKFHACSRAYFCDDFRSVSGDRYIAIKVAVSDLHSWPNPQYYHKIAFKACVVLHEVDRWGEEVKP
jgi:hypothetical protein